MIYMDEVWEYLKDNGLAASGWTSADISNKFGLSDSGAQHHTQNLVRAGLAKETGKRRNGKKLFVSTNSGVNKAKKLYNRPGSITGVDYTEAIRHLVQYVEQLEATIDKLEAQIADKKAVLR